MTGPDTKVVQWTPPRGPPRRLEFEPVDGGWRRREREWTGCCWRDVGVEVIDDVHLDDPAAVRERVRRSFDGP